MLHLRCFIDCVLHSGCFLYQTSEMKLFAKIVNVFQLLTIFTKSFTLDVSLDVFLHFGCFLNQTSKMKLFVKIGNVFQPLTIFAKSSSLNVSLVVFFHTFYISLFTFDFFVFDVINLSVFFEEIRSYKNYFELG